MPALLVYAFGALMKTRLNCHNFIMQPLLKANAAYYG